MSDAPQAGPDDGAPNDAAIPMFPLGTVLLPGQLLPLRLFEPRYLVFIADVLAADRTFGVVLIERGHEVGGGDVRTSIGCRAIVRKAGRMPDGTWRVLAQGIGRFEVRRWLPDDPYPRAVVEPFTDLERPDELEDLRWVELTEAFRRLERRLRERAGQPHEEMPLPPTPAEATFEMAAALPMGPYDRQRVLAARTPEERRVLLLDAIATIGTLVDGPETS